MKIIVLISLVLQSLIFGKCLDINEKNRLEMALENFKFSGFYQDVPNYIQCNHKKTNLEKLVCENPDLLLMFNVLSKVNVSKMEEYFKKEYNHKSFNIDDNNGLKSLFDSDNVSYNNLCYDLKVMTSDRWTSEERPYNMALLSSNYEPKFYIQENKHGTVLIDRDGNKTYLGKSCDAINDKKQKGFWYKKDGSYILIIENKFFQLTANQELSLDNVNCSEEKIKKLMSK